MSSNQFRVRRATLDDMSSLMALWQSMGFAPEDLAKRITEFQVAEAADGKLAGAVGLQIAEKQGRVHSEGFTDFAFAEQLRALFWDRLQSVAANHGLLRLWTQERAPFWNHCGMAAADSEALAKLPSLWRSLTPDWLTLKLKDELQEVISADKEFALFMESERQKSQRALRQARVLKFIATAVAIGACILLLAGLFIIMRRNPQFLHR